MNAELEAILVEDEIRRERLRAAEREAREAVARAREAHDAHLRARREARARALEDEVRAIALATDAEIAHLRTERAGEGERPGAAERLARAAEAFAAIVRGEDAAPAPPRATAEGSPRRRP